MLSRRANRRDANEAELINAALSIGWLLWRLDEPCDVLGLLRGTGIWRPIEIKLPLGPRGGKKDRELTEKQQQFEREVLGAAGELLIWRTIDDVVADTQRLRAWQDR